MENKGNKDLSRFGIESERAAKRASTSSPRRRHITPAKKTVTTSGNVTTSTSSEEISSESEEEEADITCCLCYQVFSSPLELQVHLTTQKHPPLDYMRTNTYQDDPTYTCTTCSREVQHYKAPAHTCFQEKIIKYRAMLAIQKEQHASPFICIHCKSKKFQNRFALTIHIIMQHTRTAGSSLHCPICKCIFKTMSSNVMEMHGLQVHLPEMIMIYRRMKAEECKTHIDVSQPFVCLYPSERFSSSLQHQENVHEASLFKNKYCEKEFDSASQLTSHLIAFHGLLNIQKNIRKKFRYFCTDCRPLMGFDDFTSLLRHVKDQHDLAARNLAILAAKRMGMRERFNAELVCFQCWTVFPSNIDLQAHIACAHVTKQWRRCDSCGREHCKPDESVSDSMMCLLIEKHERRHAAILKEHIDILMKGTTLPESIPIRTPKPIFFAEIKIIDWKQHLLAARAKPKLSRKTLKYFEKLREKNIKAQTERAILGLN